MDTFEMLFAPSSSLFAFFTNFECFYYCLPSINCFGKLNLNGRCLHNWREIIVGNTAPHCKQIFYWQSLWLGDSNRTRLCLRKYLISTFTKFDFNIMIWAEIYGTNASRNRLNHFLIKYARKCVGKLKFGKELQRETKQERERDRERTINKSF